MSHNPAHVFEILFECEFRWSHIPKGNHVRICHSGDKVPPGWERHRAGQFESLSGVVVGKRKLLSEAYRVRLDVTGEEVDFPIDFLEPTFASRREAEIMLSAVLE